MGYDPEYFIDINEGSSSSSSYSPAVIDESLLCVVCHNVYDTPMVLDPCGHSFCRDCVAELLEQGHENCPICRTSILIEGNSGVGVGVPPNRALTSLIGNMHIRCMNNEIIQITKPSSTTTCTSDDGNNTTCCSWKGKLSNFMNHVEKGNCPLHIIQCSVSGCTWEGYRHELTKHNNDNVEYHTTLIMETKLSAMVEKKMQKSMSTTSAGGGGGGGTINDNDNDNNTKLNYELQQQLEIKDHEIHALKSRLLDNWLSDFFHDWIIEKQVPHGRYAYFHDFVVYRPIKYLQGQPIKQLIVGIPGPTGSDWSGGLYPLLITFSSEGYERKEPPKCNFPATFFHPNVYDDGNVHVNTLVGFDGFWDPSIWDPSISLPELFFCIQQLLVHPNHHGLNNGTHRHDNLEVYDPIEYQRIVLEQSEKYQYNTNTTGRNNNNVDGSNGTNDDHDHFLSTAMVELQSKIDPEYKKPLESWENERWENLELVRWKGQRSFQQQRQGQQGQGVGGRITPPHPRPSLVDNDNNIDTTDDHDGDDDDDVQLIMTTNSNTSIPDDNELENGDISCDIGGGDIGTNVHGNNTDNINDLISRARRTTRSLSSSVAVAVATNSNSNSNININSNNSNSHNAAPLTALRDNNGNICKCSCCIIGSHCFIDPSTKMRYIFGEGG